MSYTDDKAVSHMYEKDIIERLKARKNHAAQYSFYGFFIFESASQSIPFSINHIGLNKQQTKISSIDGPPFDVLLVGTSRAFHAANANFQAPVIQYDALSWSSIDFNKDFERYYQVTPRGQQRIANRIADIIDIYSINSDKYSLRLFIDDQTGLLLKKILFDEKNNIIETYSFIDITLAEPQEAFTSDMPLIEGYKNVNGKVAPVIDSNPIVFKWLPEGLKQTASTAYGQDAVYQFSDGIYQITVFIELNVSQSNCHDKENRQGGFSGFCKSVTVNNKHYQLTVTGNAPLNMVKKIAENIAFESL